MMRAESALQLLVLPGPRQRGVAHVVVEVEAVVVDPDRVVLERDVRELLAVARDAVQRGRGRRAGSRSTSIAALAVAQRPARRG